MLLRQIRRLDELARSVRWIEAFGDYPYAANLSSFCTRLMAMNPIFNIFWIFDGVHQVISNKV